MKYEIEDLRAIKNESYLSFARTMAEMECANCPFERECSKYGGQVECTILGLDELGKIEKARETNKMEVTLTGAINERVTLIITEQQSVLLNYLYENGWLRDNVCIFTKEDEEAIDLT